VSGWRERRRHAKAYRGRHLAPSIDEQLDFIEAQARPAGWLAGLSEDEQLLLAGQRHALAGLPTAHTANGAELADLLRRNAGLPDLAVARILIFIVEYMQIVHEACDTGEVQADSSVELLTITGAITAATVALAEFEIAPPVIP